MLIACITCTWCCRVKYVLKRAIAFMIGMLYATLVKLVVHVMCRRDADDVLHEDDMKKWTLRVVLWERPFAGAYGNKTGGNKSIHYQGNEGGAVREARRKTRRGTRGEQKGDVWRQACQKVPGPRDKKRDNGRLARGLMQHPTAVQRGRHEASMARKGKTNAFESMVARIRHDTNKPFRII